MNPFCDIKRDICGDGTLKTATNINCTDSETLNMSYQNIEKFSS